MSDITTVLKSLTAVNLSISLWTGRKKLNPTDLGNATLPPEELASLGSKRICSPDSLKVFSTLKSRAVSQLNKIGVKFLSGWMIPDDKVADTINELVCIRDKFNDSKEAFLANYDATIKDWIQQHAEWESILTNSIANVDYVRNQIQFSWQCYHLKPVNNKDSGLNEEVQNLNNTLFSEVAASANAIWENVLSGKEFITHKGLSPLRTLKQKLAGLSILDHRAIVVSDMIDNVLQRMPAKGNIDGIDLTLVQGIVCLLRDQQALFEHADKAMQSSTDSVLDSLILNNAKQKQASVVVAEPEVVENIPTASIPVTTTISTGINSMGLW